MMELKGFLEKIDTEVLSIEDAFNYCEKLCGIRFRWETIIKKDYYIIAPGLGNVAKYSFELRNDKRLGPVITPIRGRSFPTKFSRDKSLKTNDIYTSQISFGMEYEFWKPTKTVIEKLISACLE